MLPYPTILLISLAGVLVFTVVVFITTGSIMSSLVVLTLAGIIFYILNLFGMLKVDVTTSGLDIGFYEKAPVPAGSKPASPSKPIEKREVFYVSGNLYGYDDAPSVCAAYDADLASYDQVLDAYRAGAEWCGYGWSLGGMALYPTQKSTWQLLQGEVDNTKRTSCGIPGVNGGYFDPATKFGVNCYGVKPTDKSGSTYPQPPSNTSGVNKFKPQVGSMTVASFNRDGWSEYNISSHV